MRLDTSRPKSCYKNSGALYNRVILSIYVWPFVYLRHIARPITKHKHWTKPWKKISHLIPQGNTQVLPSPAGHLAQMWSEGQEGFLLPSLGNSAIFNRAAWNRFSFLLFVYPLLQKFAKWNEDHRQCCKGWKSHFPKDVINLEKHWPQKGYKKNKN